jgi:hypothetical protein
LFGCWPEIDEEQGTSPPQAARYLLFLNGGRRQDLHLDQFRLLPIERIRFPPQPRQFVFLSDGRNGGGSARMAIPSSVGGLVLLA